ncbi:MAG: anti-sigma factor [Ruegeria sp.]|uniref:anti-sigma factor family protein n=1 Tax=Ruegeria sp. TaxID=1879320 RepID=UPI00349E8C06
MNRAQATFSDEELTAYLDGEADAPLRDRIDQALADDPALAEQLQGLELPLDAMRDALSADMLGAPAMPAGLLPAPQPRRAPLALVASVALAFGLGALSTYLLQPKAQPPGWKAVVASYQSLYVTDTVADAAQPPEMTAQVLAGFGADHGVDLTPAQSVQGLEFKRAQILGFRGKPLLQMAYLGENGVPVAFCITRSKGEDRGPQNETLAGLAATSWVSNGVGYLVIGGQDQDVTETLAKELIQQLG